MFAHKLASIVLLAMSCMTVAARHVCAAAAWPDAPCAFVILRDGTPGDVHAFIDALDAAGGHASVVYPPRALTVYADAAILSGPELRVWIAQTHTDEVDELTAAAYGIETARAARAWNRSLQIGATTQENPPAFAPWPDAGPVPASALRTPAPPGIAASDNLPLGAEFYDTSEYLAGSSAVGVWLLEAAGSTYDWTQAEEDLTLGGVQASLDNWVAKGGAGAFLTFFLDIHTGVPVSGVPIESPMSSDATWVNEALASEGWPGADGFARCWAYNNAIRDTFDTNWCFSIVIVDSDPSVNQGLFVGGGYAWAYFGGPFVYMSRYSTWAFNWQNYYGVVPMHEMGHIYYATDEYDGSQQLCGYLNAADNQFTSVLCIMNQNDSTRVCLPTKRQIAWRDADNDSIIEPLDTEPTAVLAQLLPDPTPDPTPTWNGSASVTTIPNLNPITHYAPAHDITIVTIDAVECRVDGGAWSAAIPADGAFDDYAEDFAWTAPPLSNGQHVVQARSRTTVGNWTLAFGSDTVTVAGATGVGGPEGPAHVLSMSASTPNPVVAGASFRITLPARGPARVEIYAIDGSRVRTLAEGMFDAGARDVIWDGRDMVGRFVASGVYVCRLESDQGRSSRKLIVAR